LSANVTVFSAGHQRKELYWILFILLPMATEVSARQLSHTLLPNSETELGISKVVKPEELKA
jgi:hypothetical protein